MAQLADQIISDWRHRANRLQRDLDFALAGWLSLSEAVWANQRAAEFRRGAGRETEKTRRNEMLTRDKYAADRDKAEADWDKAAADRDKAAADMRRAEAARKKSEAVLLEADRRNNVMEVTP